MRGSVPFLLLLAGAPLAAQSPLPAGPLTLEAAIQLGRSRGVQAALARATERIAEARVGQRRAEMLPSVSAGAGWTRQTVNFDEFGPNFSFGVTDPFSIYRAQLRASQSLVDPAVWARVRAARDSVVAAGLDSRNAGALSGAAAGIAWLRLYSAEETVRAREADSTTAWSLLEQSRRLLDAGVSAAIDLTRSDVTYNTVRADLYRARDDRDRARLDLARTLDIPPTAPFVIADRIDAEGLPLIAGADSAVGFALANRADLAAEQKRLEVLTGSRRAIRAEQLPSLGIAGSVQQTGIHLDDTKGSWTFQVGLTIPILDGFRRQFRTQEQSARVEAQTIRLHDLTATVESEVRQALLELSSAEGRMRIAAERQRLAEQELQQAQERFTAGVAGTLETSNAQLSLTAARDGLIQARVAYGVARVSAMRAMGLGAP